MALGSSRSAAAAGGAVTYCYPDLGRNGRNFGDLLTFAGGRAGWRLSIKELMSCSTTFAARAPSS
jgi:hypothetical protein